MDEQLRQKLIDRMMPVKPYRGGFVPISMPLVALEEYFAGSDGEAGLLCNSVAEPDNDTVLRVFRSVRERDQVYDVRIALTQCDDDEWPFSDKVVVVTNADDQELLGWLPEGFDPDEIWDEHSNDLKAETIEVPAGYRTVWLWYD